MSITYVFNDNVYCNGVNWCESDPFLNASSSLVYFVFQVQNEFCDLEKRNLGESLMQIGRD